MAFHSRTKAAAVIRALLLLLAALLFFGLSLRLSAPQLRDIAFAAESSDWPSVPGAVAMSQAVPGPRRIGNVPKVQYTYFALGRSYMGERVQFGNVNGSKEWGESVAARFPVGPVRVFYRSEAPHETVLIPGELRPSTYFTTAVSLAFGGPGLYCLLRAIRQLKNASGTSPGKLRRHRPRS